MEPEGSLPHSQEPATCTYNMTIGKIKMKKLKKKHVRQTKE
jgi:hypothetical protein